MHLTLDIGNTRTKMAVFDGDRMVATGSTALSYPIRRAAACRTGSSLPQGLPVEPLMVDASLRLPISIDYLTPQTIGPDRIAAACGAWKQASGRSCLIVDAGTCITIDYLDGQGTYHGGAILPGIGMKFNALNTFTAKLPLITDALPGEDLLAGRSTRDSIVAGVLTASRMEVEGFVNRYRTLDPAVRVLVTGGDAELLLAAGELANQGAQHEPYLVMIGLNEILKLQ